MKDESDVRKLIKALEEIEAKGYGDLPIFIELPETFSRLWHVGVHFSTEGKEGYEGGPEKFIGISAFPNELLQMLEHVINISESKNTGKTSH
jgi:hypothetical protein